LVTEKQTDRRRQTDGKRWQTDGKGYRRNAISL